MSESNAKILSSEHQVLIEKIGYFNVKSVLLCLKISQCYRGSNDTKLYQKYITLSFLGALSIDITEDIQVDICCDLLVSLGHQDSINDAFKTLLESYVRTNDIFGLCNTLAANTREDANHDNVWEHITDVYQVIMLQSLALENLHPPFPKTAIMHGYAELLRFRGDHSGAITYHKDCLNMRRELYKSDPTHIYFALIAQSASCCGAALTNTGCYDEAERLLTEALTIRNRLKRERTDVSTLLDVAKSSSDIADLFFAKGESHIRRSQDWYQVAVADLEEITKISNISNTMLCRAHVLLDRARGRLGYAIEMQAVMMIRDAHEMILTSRSHIFNNKSVSKLPSGHPTVVEIHEMNLFTDRVVGGIESASNIIFSKLDSVFLLKENKSKKKGVLPTGDLVRDEVDRIYNESLRLLNMSQLDAAMSMVNECISRAKNLSSEESSLADSAPPSGTALSTEAGLTIEAEAIKAHPRLADCVYTQAQILLTQGKYDNSTKLFDKAGKINAARQRVVPQAVQCMIGLAECALGKGDTERSTRIMQEAMTVLLTRPETEGNIRMQPNFRYDVGVSDADNTLTLAQALHTISKIALSKGFYSASWCLQNESERFLNEVSAEYEVNVDLDLADSQWLKGKILLAVGKSEEAVLLASTAQGMYSNLFSASSSGGDEVMHHKVADALLLGAEANLMSAHFSEASTALIKALATYRHVFPEIDHDSIAWALYLQAKVAAAMGKHQQTEAMFKQASAVCKKATVVCSLGIADSFQATGKYSEAGEIYSKVLSKWSKKSHPQGLQILLSVAKNLRLSGKYSLAQSTLDSFTSLRPRNRDSADFVEMFGEIGHIMPTGVVVQDTTGDQLPIDATFHLESAEIHRALGQFNSANTEYEKCIDVVRALHGTRHPLIADAIFWQVENLRDSGYGEKVTLKPSKKALHLRKNLFGDQHIDVAFSMQTLGDIDAARGDYVGARVYLRTSLSILEGRLGSCSAPVASVVNSLGRVNTLEGEYKDAHRHLEAALNLRIRLFGEESVFVAESLNNIAELYRLQRNFEEAKKYCNRALRMFRVTLGDNHPKTINSEGNMGLIMVASEQDSEMDVGSEMIDSALSRLTVRNTGDQYILSNHPWIRKFKAGKLGSGREMSEIVRLASDDEEEALLNDTSHRSTTSNGGGSGEKQLTLKVKRLKSDNEYLKTKNDEYLRQLNSLKSQIKLLEIRAHNAEELSQGSKHMLATLQSHDSPISVNDKTPQKQKPMRIGSLAASLGYARKMVKQSGNTGSPRKYQTP